MAQGAVKKKVAGNVKQAVAKRNNRKLTAKAAKSLKPKRKNAQQQAALTKKHTSALTAATEKLVSSKVGHLEILTGTRRELENEKKK